MASRSVVLCVDDEPTLLRTFPIALGRAGFRVAVADDGATGLALFCQLRHEVCLVLTDIIMPRMSGIDMAERILQLEPQTKILLMSAYTGEAGRRQGHRRGFPFIRKPFNYATLVEKIRSIATVPEAATVSRGSGISKVATQ